MVLGYTNPQNLNRYSYVNNNPLRYTDPTGHMRVEDPGSSKGSINCSKNAQYCNGGKQKSKEELAAMRPHHPSSPISATPATNIPTSTFSPTVTPTATVTPTCTNPTNNCATSLAIQATSVAFQTPTATAMATPSQVPMPIGMDFVDDTLNTCTTPAGTCGSEFGGPVGMGFDMTVNGAYFIGDRIEDANNEPAMTQQEAQRGLSYTLVSFFTSILPWVLTLP